MIQKENKEMAARAISKGHLLFTLGIAYFDDANDYLKAANALRFGIKDAARKVDNAFENYRKMFERQFMDGTNSAALNHDAERYMLLIDELLNNKRNF